jgi:alpha-tubulin suppressor-like RCC1 family protein
LALTDKGEVYSWGQNIHGELGIGNRVNTGKPTHIRSIEGKVKQISAGSCHAAALTENGTVYTWGNGNKGRYKKIPRKFSHSPASDMVHKRV